MTYIRKYPTHDEVLAIELAARRAQAAELERLSIVAVRKAGAFAIGAVKVAGRALTRSAQDTASRAPAARATDIAEFSASLPEDLRRRYASELAAAERVEPLINFGLAAWNFGVGTIARGIQAAARGLHAAARSLEGVACRMAPAQCP